MRLNYIHSFRALAIILIVAGHSIEALTWDDEATEKILKIFINNGSVLLVFIAGYLFQHLLTDFKCAGYYKQKLKNVLLPYIIVSVPAIVVFVFVVERDGLWAGFYNNALITQIVLFLVTGKHLTPLWFVPMIALFYAVGPILKKADQYNTFYRLLPVLVIVSCLYGRGLPWQSFVHFFSAYVFGMWCSKNKASINGIVCRAEVLVLFATLVVSLGMIEYVLDSGTMTYVNYLQKLAMALLLLGVGVRFESSLNNRPLNFVADISFGIFFIHAYTLFASKQTYQFIFTELPQGALLPYIVITIYTLLLSSIAVMVVRWVSASRSKILIGC